MAKLKHIKDLIKAAIKRSSESDDIEFKDARKGFPTLWKPISGFSNTPGGGYIVFGVAEDKKTRELKVVGCPELALIQEKTVAYLRDKMRNPGDHTLKMIEYQEHSLLILEIRETPREYKPCYQADLGLPRGACVRVGNTNRVITEEEMRSFLRYSPAYKYDRVEVPLVGIKDLAEVKIQEFLSRSAERVGRSFPANLSRDKVLKNMGVIGTINSRNFVTLAGMLIFAKGIPQQSGMLARYITRCVRYAGNSSSSPIVDKKDLYGTLDSQVDEALKFVLRNIAVRAQIVGTKRIESFEYPVDALREVIVNSVVHRDYSTTNTYIHVGVYADRVEISNPGTLPPGVTIENLKDSQFSRNEVIADLMRGMDYMEEFGRGIDLVYARMSSWGLVEPLFKNRSNMFKVTLLGERFKDLNERQVKIWHFLQDENSITARIAHGLFPDVSRPTVNGDLRTMVDLGLVSTKGSSSNTRYEPKY